MTTADQVRMYHPIRTRQYRSITDNLTVTVTNS